MSDTHTMSRATDPDTSHEAAAGHVASGANELQRAAVLAALVERPGMTSDEVAWAARMGRHAAARRLPELERAGLVVRGAARVSAVGGRRGLTWYPAAS